MTCPLLGPSLAACQMFCSIMGCLKHQCRVEGKEFPSNSEHPGPPDPSPQLFDVALALRAPWESSKQAVIFSPRITGVLVKSKGTTDTGVFVVDTFFGAICIHRHRPLFAKLKVFGDAFFDFPNKKPEGLMCWVLIPNTKISQLHFCGGFGLPRLSNSIRKR